MKAMRIGIGLVTALLAAPLAAEPFEPDGGGRIQSMEAQTILIGGERYDVAGAEVRLLEGESRAESSGDGAPPGRLVGTVSAERPIESLAPEGAGQAAYELRDDSERRIRLIWFAAPTQR